MQSSYKILSNTLVLYARLIISTIVGLFSTRIVLQTLGVDDFGIFNLIVGIVSMLSILNAAMATSTQRFLSHTMGSGNLLKLQKIFSTGLTIHLILGLLISLLLAFFGHIIIINYLNLPIERITVASKIFMLVIISTFFSIITTPYEGSLTANENFNVIAIAELALSFTRLGSAIYLLYTGFDKLIIYAVFTTISTIGIAIFKQIYCVKNYHECVLIPKYFEKVYFKEMLSFASWNLFGALCNLARGQGLAVAMNVYFGVVVNAAYGIANQVNGQVSSISATVTRAIYPQLIKSEGDGDRDRMFRLSIVVSKLPFLLMSFFAIPIIIEMQYILKLWLTNVPEYAVGLSVLVILLSLFSTLSNGLIAAVQSIGQIKLYQFVTGSLLIIGLPLAIIFFKLGFNVNSAIVIAIILEIVAHVFRLLFLKKIANLSIINFVTDVDVKPMILLIITFLVSYFSSRFIEPNFIRLVFVSVLSSSILLCGIYFYILNKQEKELINTLYYKIKTQFRKRT